MVPVPCPVLQPGAWSRRAIRFPGSLLRRAPGYLVFKNLWRYWLSRPSRPLFAVCLLHPQYVPKLPLFATKKWSPNAFFLQVTQNAPLMPENTLRELRSNYAWSPIYKYAGPICSGLGMVSLCGRGDWYRYPLGYPTPPATGAVSAFPLYCYACLAWLPEPVLLGSALLRSAGP